MRFLRDYLVQVLTCVISGSSNTDILGAPKDYSQTLGADQEQVGRNEGNPEARAEDNCEDETFLTDETTPRFVKSSIY